MIKFTKLFVVLFASLVFTSFGCTSNVSEETLETQIKPNVILIMTDDQGYGDLLSLIHISEPTRPERISYAVFCLKKKKN